MELGAAQSENAEMEPKQAELIYDKYAELAKELMVAKIMIMVRHGEICALAR